MSWTNPWPHQSRERKSWTWGLLYSLPNHFTPFLNMKSPSLWFFQSPSLLLRIDSTIGHAPCMPPFPTALPLFSPFFSLSYPTPASPFKLLLQNADQSAEMSNGWLFLLDRHTLPYHPSSCWQLSYAISWGGVHTYVHGTHAHTHKYNLTLLKSPFSRFEFPYPALSRQGWDWGRKRAG